MLCRFVVGQGDGCVNVHDITQAERAFDPVNNFFIVTIYNFRGDLISVTANEITGCSVYCCRFAVGRGDGCISVHDIAQAERAIQQQDAAAAARKKSSAKAKKARRKGSQVPEDAGEPTPDSAVAGPDINGLVTMLGRGGSGHRAAVGSVTFVGNASQHLLASGVL